MDTQVDQRIGRNAILLVLQDPDEQQEHLHQALARQGFSYYIGKSGAMETHKIVAAVETAAKKNGIIREDLYRETHALYHAIMEALHGVTRGQIQLGTVLRTVGLRFSVIRGRPYTDQGEGDWVAVAFYGTIGAPVKGLEHEAVGLGINHI